MYIMLNEHCIRLPILSVYKLYQPWPTKYVLSRPHMYQLTNKLIVSDYTPLYLFTICICMLTNCLPLLILMYLLVSAAWYLFVNFHLKIFFLEIYCFKFYFEIKSSTFINAFHRIFIPYGIPPLLLYLGMFAWQFLFSIISCNVEFCYRKTLSPIIVWIWTTSVFSFVYQTETQKLSQTLPISSIGRN